MNPIEIFRSALRGVTANPLRSILTMLGVLIGVASVILLLAVGNGSAAQVQSAINGLGTTTLTVRSSGQSATLTQDMSDKLAAAGLGHVARVVPQATTSQTVESANSSQTSTSSDSSSSSTTSVVGTTADYFDLDTKAVQTGSAFTADDVTRAQRVAVLGSTTAENLFGSARSAVGQSVTIDGASYTVKGVLESQGGSGASDADDVVIAPITRVQRSFTGFSTISSITVEATDADSVTAAEAEVEVVLDQLLGITDSSSRTYQVTNQSSLLETQAESAQSFTVLLGAVAAISLLVGGIGVTNVMLVTVTERTREIGIRKAIGATRGVILWQFLVEAAMLTLTGGLLGVLIALVGAQFEINGTQPVIVAASIPLALGVSVAIGVFFGAYPAARAASLRPIQALRSV